MKNFCVMHMFTEIKNVSIESIHIDMYCVEGLVVFSI